MLAKGLLKRAAQAAMLPRAYSKVRKLFCEPWACIVSYHRVDHATNHPWAMKPLDPAHFESEIILLMKHYDIVPLEELVRELRASKTLANHRACITFDDGFRDNYLHAYPILKKYSLPATIFLVTGNIESRKLGWSDEINYACWHTRLDDAHLPHIGKVRLSTNKDRNVAARAIKNVIKQHKRSRRKMLSNEFLSALESAIPEDVADEYLLTWSDIEQMSKDRIDFGAHTLSHERLSELSPDEAALEIGASKTAIEERLKKPVTCFAYPFGSRKDYSDETVRLVRELGFSCAVTLSHGLVTKNPDHDGLFRLPRISGSNPTDYEFGISGVSSDVWRKKMVMES